LKSLAWDKCGLEKAKAEVALEPFGLHSGKLPCVFLGSPMAGPLVTMR
jgi:hypothetical protein